MKNSIQELDYQQTAIGELTLRVRRSPSLGNREVYEVRLNNEFLMSSAVNVSEIALADLGLAAFDGPAAAVLVGGLGLGCTAAAALAHPGIERLDVVEYLEPVIGWHRRGLVPEAGKLTGDPRCTLIHDDFFRYVGEGDAATKYDVILVDIDHSPNAWLAETHGRFYTPKGITRLTARLRPGGVFAFWSADPPDQAFLDLLRSGFQQVRVHPVTYQHPMLHQQEEDTIIVAR